MPERTDRFERPEKIEDTWLADRWLAPVLDLPELRPQVRRGRILARKGWVRDLTIRPGLVTAEVTSDSGESHSVKIRMDAIDGPTWVAVAEAVSDEAALAADLLRGRLSERMAELFEEAGHDLFPFDLRDLSNYCSCREDAVVCTGAVATHIHLAEAMQADPMKLLQLRGRDKEWLVEEVRGRRGAMLAKLSPASAASSKLAPPRNDPSESALGLKDGFWVHGELPTMTFRVERGELDHEDILPVLRALGPGPGDTAPTEIIAALAPLLRTGRLRIEEVMDRSENGTEEAPLEVEPVPQPESLDDTIIQAAGQHGQLTTGFVAQALGVSTREAREYLQFLVAQGKLRVIGKARGTRYLPAGAADPAPVADRADDGNGEGEAGEAPDAGA